MTLNRIHSNVYINIALSIVFALIVLAFRIRITHTFFYSFLIWNLFLAGIPLFISQSLKYNRFLRQSTAMSYLLFLAWLLFLPNSPYIITDLVHLHNDNSTLVWLDLFLVFVFALNGLVLGLLSMLDMFALIQERYGTLAAKYTLFKVCLLSGYGIYLGRFLRFNSWDIATKPFTLFYQILQSLREPEVWLVTFAFGGFLWILFSVLQSVTPKRESIKFNQTMDTPNS